MDNMTLVRVLRDDDDAARKLLSAARGNRLHARAAVTHQTRQHTGIGTIGDHSIADPRRGFYSHDDDDVIVLAEHDILFRRVQRVFHEQAHAVSIYISVVRRNLVVVQRTR